MKKTFQWLGLAWVACASLLPTVEASVAVVSNLEAEGELSAALLNAAGVPLAAGCHARLVTFPGKSEEEIEALAATGISPCLAGAVTFGEASSVGTGSGLSGQLEFQTEQSLGEPLAGLHAIILNAADPASATEMLLLRLPLVLPADGLSGPAAHMSVHLEDAEPVFGTRTAAGFSTRVSPIVAAFDAWILAQLGPESLPSDRLAGADPDRDGMENLLEYAMGSGPAAGSSHARLHLRRAAGGEVFVQYPRRSDDPRLSFQVEHGASLSGDAWLDLESSESTPLEEPFPAPAGCEWVEQALPASGRAFARLSVAMDAEVP